MELFNIENPYYEVWKVGRPCFMVKEKTLLHWHIIKKLNKNKSLSIMGGFLILHSF